MKGYIIVDIPLKDLVEFDEYGMVAEVDIMPETMTTRLELCGHIERVEIRPLPSRRRSMVEWIDAKVKTHDLTEYDKGWNDCIEFLEGEDND